MQKSPRHSNKHRRLPRRRVHRFSLLDITRCIPQRLQRPLLSLRLCSIRLYRNRARRPSSRRSRQPAKIPPHSNQTGLLANQPFLHRLFDTYRSAGPLQPPRTPRRQVHGRRWRFPLRDSNRIGRDRCPPGRNEQRYTSRCPLSRKQRRIR